MPARLLGVEIKVADHSQLFENYVWPIRPVWYAEAQIPRYRGGRAAGTPIRNCRGVSPSVQPEAVRDAGDLQAQIALLDGSQLGSLRRYRTAGTGHESRFTVAKRLENAAPISSNDLMRLLSTLQTARGPWRRGVRTSATGSTNCSSGSATKSAVLGWSARRTDDVINLVSMLFELSQMTAPCRLLKALDGRIDPDAQVGLLDTDLLQPGSHPARRLLNEIASALGWAEHNDAWRDSLYQKTEQVEVAVERRGDDLAIFAELLRPHCLSPAIYAAAEVRAACSIIARATILLATWSRC